MRLLIYVPLLTSRVEYAFQLLFGSALSLAYEFTSDESFFRRSAGPRLNYSEKPLVDGELWLPAGPLLGERGIRPLSPDAFLAEGLPAFFAQSAPGAALPFDLPALAFFLASRYEEYLPFHPDRLGRFPASESFAYRQGFLQQPLVNQWALHLADLLRQRFPGLNIKQPAYHFQPTYDVDLAWAYQHRPAWRLVLASLRDSLTGQWPAFKERAAVLTGRRSDPFYTFDYLKRLHQQYQLTPLYFFLLGNAGTYDKSIRHTVPAFRQLIRKIAQGATVGIHPSFRSNSSAMRLEKEIRRLEAITDRKVLDSRQHFLMLRFPHTYTQLLETGVRNDYSMGFADAPGFRASMATPFPWYNLEKERMESLKVFPFAAMDVTLRQYQRLAPEQAFLQLCRLSDTVRKVGGDFITLWHNSSFSVHHGWCGWREVYEKIVSYAR